jgi:hypothetical protein
MKRKKKGSSWERQEANNKRKHEIMKTKYERNEKRNKEKEREVRETNT